MKKWAYLVLVCVSLSACLEDGPAKKEEPKSFVDQLPQSQRELIAGPLEHAMDDLKESIIKDQSLFESSAMIQTGGKAIASRFKLNGNDTMMLHVKVLNKDTTLERHEWYYDKDGHLFFSEHHFEQATLGVAFPVGERHYKVYHEENGNALSSYAKVGVGSTEAPKDWQPVSLSPEEVSALAKTAGVLRGREANP